MSVITMRHGTAALSCVCLLAASFPSFAQSSNSATTADQDKPAAASAPAGSPQAPSLGDLGFPTDQTKGNAQEQARLDKRSHMLKIHQRLGLITLAPLVATLIASSGAKPGHTNASGVTVGGGTTASRDLHAALGITTAGMYLTTASFAVFAPKISGTKTRGPIKVHKILACIHGPGMILTPILGAMAYQQINSGQKVHGIASAHGAVAAVTAHRVRGRDVVGVHQILRPHEQENPAGDCAIGVSRLLRRTGNGRSNNPRSLITCLIRCTKPREPATRRAAKAFARPGSAIS